MLNMDLVTTLTKAVQEQTAYCDLLRYMEQLNIYNNSIRLEICDAIEKSAEKVNSALWDLFTDYYDITEAQHKDYDRFDYVYENLVEESGAITYLVSDEDGNCIKLLNPIPIEFLEMLEDETELYIEIDIECDEVTIYTK